jgi:hypothetical protein
MWNKRPAKSYRHAWSAAVHSGQGSHTSFKVQPRERRVGRDLLCQTCVQQVRWHRFVHVDSNGLHVGCANAVYTVADTLCGCSKRRMILALEMLVSQRSDRLNACATQRPPIVLLDAERCTCNAFVAQEAEDGWAIKRRGVRHDDHHNNGTHTRCHLLRRATFGGGQWRRQVSPFNRRSKLRPRGRYFFALIGRRRPSSGRPPVVASRCVALISHCWWRSAPETLNSAAAA